MRTYLFVIGLVLVALAGCKTTRTAHTVTPAYTPPSAAAPAHAAPEQAIPARLPDVG
jgi:hypothetical protein